MAPLAQELAASLDLALVGNLKAIADQAATLETLDPQWVPFAHHRQLAKAFNRRQTLDFAK